MGKSILENEFQQLDKHAEVKQEMSCVDQAKKVAETNKTKEIKNKLTKTYQIEGMQNNKVKVGRRKRVKSNLKEKSQNIKKEEKSYTDKWLAEELDFAASIVADEAGDASCKTRNKLK